MSDPTGSSAGVPARGRLVARRAAAARAAVSPVDAPPRLAPFSWAFSVEADAGRRRARTSRARHLRTAHPPARPGRAGRLEGAFRLVCFVQARLEPEQLGDELLPRRLAWLTEALDYGPNTRTGWHRHPDIVGPLRRHRRAPARRRHRAPRVLDPRGIRSDAHAEAFCDARRAAAGLPPSEPFYCAMVGLNSGPDLRFAARSDRTVTRRVDAVDNAVTFTRTKFDAITTLDRLGGYAASTTPPRAVGRTPLARGSGAGRGATTDSREVVTWPL